MNPSKKNPSLGLLNLRLLFARESGYNGDMTSSFFQAMQDAVDIVGESLHPVNKVAASVMDESGHVTSSTNMWPEVILKTLGQDQRIGDDSGTVHAETACLLKTPCTHGGRIFVTDPPCPNCMKNIAEAGIREVYIDHKGFEKDFMRRRGSDFVTMTLRIAAEAGLSVYALNREEQKIAPILEIPSELKRAPIEPKVFMPAAKNIMLDAFKTLVHDTYGDNPYALCYGTKTNGHRILMGTAQRVISTEPSTEIGKQKYNYTSTPINRLLMKARAHGITLEADSLISSCVPTGREMVNLLGAGHNGLTIVNPNEAADESSHDALALLRQNNILTAPSLS